jgi:RHS repeat-associated protein
LGSRSLTTDDTGDIVSEVRYLPYGEERWTSGASPTDFTFTGQRNEAGFGLMDYNARYYNPRLGRFVSPDTVVPEPESSGGFNRYAYVMNNPVRYTDPSGHQGENFFRRIWNKVHEWWILNNPYGGSISSPPEVLDPGEVFPEKPEPEDMMGPLLVDGNEAEKLKQANEIVDQAEELAPLINQLNKDDPRVNSNPDTGRADSSHPSYDDALRSARDNAGDLGPNTEKVYDPNTGTLIGERGDKRGWRIDDDHANWWD